ncbi:deoxynucleoside monophosphate kinase [Vibrio phage EniLVp02]
MIYGINGKKRSGKDTVGLTIAELLHAGSPSTTIRIDKFARRMKESILHGFKMVMPGVGITYADMDGDGCDREVCNVEIDDACEILIHALHYLKLNVTPVIESQIREIVAYTKLRREPFSPVSIRILLQLMGTEIVRSLYDENFWVNAVIDAHKEAVEKNPDTITIVTDCRFDNEAQGIMDSGDEYRLLMVIRDTLNNNTETSQHDSEHGIVDNSGHFEIIPNNGSIEDLQNYLKEKYTCKTHSK